MSQHNQSITIGKIHSVEVENFVTYDHILLHAGDYLNIILGPNGTGKSTIVAAIVLGMGGNPKILSRSSNIEDYIKNGKESASIKILIYKNTRKETTCFERHINMRGKSLWKVNGQQVKEKEFIKTVASFNIQVNNLCQFLPQDRVQDFAKMNSHEILISTLSSVFDQELIENFNQLKELRKEQLNSKNSIAKSQQKLKEAQQKHDELQSIVSVINERKELVKRIEIYGHKKQWLKCEQIKSEIAEIEKSLEQQKNIFETNKKILDELEKQSNQKQKNFEEITKIQRIEKEKQKEQKTKLDDLKNKYQELKSEINLARHDLESKKKNESEKEKRIFEASTVLEGYILDIQQYQIRCGSTESRIEKEKQFSEQLKTFEIDRENLMDKHAKINRTLDESYTPKLQLVKRKLSEFENVASRRFSMLKDRFEDAYKGVLWLRQNRHLFEGEIYEPMLLELNIKNNENSKYLENTVSPRDLVAFTCVCKSDVDLLIRKLRNEQNLLVNVVLSEDDDESLNKLFNDREPINNYRQYGFHSFLTDMIDGPTPIISYLCKVYRLHEIMIGSERVENYSDDIPNHVRLFFGGDQKYSVVVSKYSKQKSLLREEIRTKNLFCMNVNVEQQQKLKEELIKITRQTDALKNERTEIESNIKIITEKRREILESKKQFEAEKAQLKVYMERISSLKNNIERIQNEKHNVEEDEENFKQFMRQIVERMIEMEKRKLVCLETYIKLTINCEYYDKKRMFFQETDNEFARKLSIAKMELSGIQETLKTVNAVYEKYNEKYRENVEIVKQLCEGKTPNDKSFPFSRVFARLPNTIEEIDEKINEVQSKIDCMGSENEHVFRDFEATKETINRLTEIIQNSSNDDNNGEKLMKNIHDKIFPQINEIIQIINENFSKFMSSMGYAGEVQLEFDHERDYDKYGIKILVQYRQNSKLQVLDRFVQSGGERAVAIAVYTLSLQHLSNVPFRCVDEINQGMDSENERKIFNMIVEQTSQAEKSQYFFITPKLVSGFEYNDSMQVHVIFNGKFVSNTNNFSFR